MRRPSVAAFVVLVTLLPGVASAAPGDLDTFFSHDGKQTAFANGAVAYAVAMDHHDRIVVAGSTLSDHPDVALARLTSGGRLDPSFGNGGRVVTDLGANDYAFDVAIQDDGGIVVVGERSAATIDRVFVQRYRPNGTLDPGFADGGIAIIGFGRRFQTANAVVITTAGRIVIAGSTSNGITSRSAVARFLQDGRLDDTFGDDGRVTTDVSPSGEQLTDVLQQPDGKIVAVGWAEGSLVPAFSAVRYMGDGRLDDGFEYDGVVRLDVSVGSDKGLGAALQPDGSLVVVGSAAANGRPARASGRYVRPSRTAGHKVRSRLRRGRCGSRAGERQAGRCRKDPERRQGRHGLAPFPGRRPPRPDVRRRGTGPVRLRRRVRCRARPDHPGQRQDPGGRRSRDRWGP
jgi:uncharacterized delta-60 repeat protein